MPTSTSQKIPVRKKRARKKVSEPTGYQESTYKKFRPCGSSTDESSSSDSSSSDDDDMKVKGVPADGEKVYTKLAVREELLASDTE